MQARRIWQAAVAVAVTMLAVPVAVAPGGAAQAARPAPVLSVEVAKQARLLDGGQRAEVRVTTTCPVGALPMEALLYVNQDGNSTEFGTLGVVCDGRRHRSTTTVTALGFQLHRGAATVSSYLLLESGESVSPVHDVVLR